MKLAALGLAFILTVALGSVAVANDRPRNIQAVPGVWYVLGGHNDSVSYGGTTVRGHDANVNQKVCFEPCAGAPVADPFAAPRTFIVLPAAAVTPAAATTASAALPAGGGNFSPAQAAAATKATAPAPAVKKLPATSTN